MIKWCRNRHYRMRDGDKFRLWTISDTEITGEWSISGTSLWAGNGKWKYRLTGEHVGISANPNYDIIGEWEGEELCGEK